MHDIALALAPEPRRIFDRNPIRVFRQLSSALAAGPALRSGVVLLVAAGLIARFATLLVPHSYYPDEVFQYIEPAHHLLFGRGVVAWEYREHIRSWLLPLLIAGPMRIGAALAPGGMAYLILPKALAAVSSLALPWAMAALGRRVSPLHALYALLVGLVWYEFVYFSTQFLTDAMAVPCFMVGAVCLYRRRPAIAGALLALSVVLRFQYGPAVAIFTLCAGWRERRAFALPMLAGSGCVLAASGLIDLAMGQWPFAWVMNNVHQNIGLGRSHMWVSGPIFYPFALLVVWGVWLVPLLALAIVGARRYPALMTCALANIAVHSLIAHKEYRFILLSTAIIVLLAALGSADVVRRAQQRATGDTRLLPWIAAGGWLAASVSIGTGVEVGSWWTRATPQLSAFEALRRDPRLCGVATRALLWTDTGGYSYLHRDVPLFAYDGRAPIAQDATQFNAVVMPGRMPMPPGFRQTRCYPGGLGEPPVCVYRRPGSCTPTSSTWEINRLLVSRDQ